MKSVIHKKPPYPSIIDITHHVPPQNEMNATFLLEYCFHNLPDEAVLLLVVDPMVGTDRRILAVETSSGRAIVAPDRGFVNDMAIERVVSVENHPYNRDERSTTFHGRDWFAPVGRYLSLGGSLENLGPLVSYDPGPSLVPDIHLHSDQIRGEIVHVDRFGNLVTNIHREDLKDLTFSSLSINGFEIDRFVETYGEHSGLVTLVGSFEYLEVAEPGGSAEEKLNAEIGTKVVLRTD